MWWIRFIVLNVSFIIYKYILRIMSMPDALILK